MSGRALIGRAQTRTVVLEEKSDVRPLLSTEAKVALIAIGVIAGVAIVQRRYDIIGHTAENLFPKLLEIQRYYVRD